MKWQYKFRIGMLILIAIGLILQLCVSVENIFIYIWVLLAEIELFQKDMQVDQLNLEIITIATGIPSKVLTSENAGTVKDAKVVDIYSLKEIPKQ